MTHNRYCAYKNYTISLAGYSKVKQRALRKSLFFWLFRSHQSHTLFAVHCMITEGVHFLLNRILVNADYVHDIRRVHLGVSVRTPRKNLRLRLADDCVDYHG